VGVQEDGTKREGFELKKSCMKERRKKRRKKSQKWLGMNEISSFTSGFLFFLLFILNSFLVMNRTWFNLRIFIQRKEEKKEK